MCTSRLCTVEHPITTLVNPPVRVQPSTEFPRAGSSTCLASLSVWNVGWSQTLRLVHSREKRTQRPLVCR